jgi:hypothetical protein
MQLRRPFLMGLPIVLVVLAAVLAAAGTAPDAEGRTQAVEAPRFTVDPLWPKPLPNHWLLGSAVGVAVDARDHVFVLHLTDSFNTRTEVGAAADPPTGECCLPAPNVLEFDAEGNLVGHWGGPGEGYTWPAANHGLAIDAQGNVWIGGSAGTDTHLLKFTRDGRFLLRIGRAGAPAAAGGGGRGGAGGDTATAGRGGGRGGRGGGRGGPPPLPPNSHDRESFGGPAAIAFDPAANEAFIADGYRNRRVAVIDARTGEIKRYWGAYGERPDDADIGAYDPAAPPARQFRTVRCAEPSNDGLVYVCDRSNNRIQVFRPDGAFVREKVIAPATRGEGSVWDIAFSRDPQQRFLYVADGRNMKVHVLDRQTLEILTSIGDGGRQPGQFSAVHSVATDSRGNLYTTETYEGKRVQKFVFGGVGPVPRAGQGVVWPDSGRVQRP